MRVRSFAAGEIGVAVCVAAAGTDVAKLNIDAWLIDKIARYNLPKRYLFWTELPKSGYGKVSKKRVRELLANQV